ncbi:MAG: M23 family metallopeptidase [Novosphingobium sp.]
MIFSAFLTQFRTLAGIAAAAVTLVGSNPVMANASANADIIAPLRAAQAAKQQPAMGNGDEEFRQLFNGWQALDKGYLAASSAATRTSAVVPGLTGLPGITRPAYTMPSTVSIPARMPVEGVALTSDFGMRWHPVLGGRHQHKGVDLAGPIGTPVHATADGVVSRADWFSSYGLYVALEHGGDIETRYGHMSRLNVAAGQMVHKGDVIGFIGTTGRSTGPHLHYEVRIAGNAVNPIPYMQSGGFHHAAPAADRTLVAVAGIDEE